MRCFALALLSTAIACSGSDPEPPAASTGEPAKPGGQADPKAGPRVVERGGGDLNSPVDLRPGDKLEVSLGTPVGVAPEHRYSLGDPKLSGDAVRYLGRKRRPRPQDEDGGSDIHVFTFEARTVGEARVAIDKRFAEAAKVGTVDADGVDRDTTIDFTICVVE